MTPIIDTHQHLWDLRQFHLPWLDGGGPLAVNHTMQDYLAGSAGLNLDKTIYMEVDVEESQLVAEAEFAISMCRTPDNPMVAAVIGGRPASSGFRDYLDRFRDSPYIKGVRQVLHTSAEAPGNCTDPDFIRGVQLLGSRSLRFDLCLPAGALLQGVKLVDSCPETRFILDHCGNANVQSPDRSQWQRDTAEMARRQHVVCKISGIVASARPGVWKAEDLRPIVDHCVEVFGHERVMFGSDWPVCTLTSTLRQWVEALQKIVSGWPESEKRGLFHDNAARFYGV